MEGYSITESYMRTEIDDPKSYMRTEIDDPTGSSIGVSNTLGNMTESYRELHANGDGCVRQDTTIGVSNTFFISGYKYPSFTQTSKISDFKNILNKFHIL